MGKRRGLVLAVLIVALAACGTATPAAAPAPTTAPGATTPTTAPPTTTPTTTTAAPPSTPGRGPSEPAPLRRGAAGPEVLALQERLGELGYWLGTPDSSFGTLTSQAVLALQGAAGLSRDGVVGPDTQAALDEGVRPTARSTQGAVTEIDRDAGLVLFVRDGQVDLALHTSTGTFENYRHEGRTYLADTPEGDFTVTWTHDGWRDGDLGRLYRPRYFHPDGIAVHGYTSVPAYPASHGCARVTIEAMDMVWERDLMPPESEVLVY